MIASNDNNHSERGDDSGGERAMRGASTDSGVVEAAYHDGVVAGVAANGLIASARQRRMPPRISGRSRGRDQGASADGHAAFRLWVFS